MKNIGNTNRNQENNNMEEENSMQELYTIEEGKMSEHGINKRINDFSPAGMVLTYNIELTRAGYGKADRERLCAEYSAQLKAFNPLLPDPDAGNRDKQAVSGDVGLFEMIQDKKNPVWVKLHGIESRKVLQELMDKTLQESKKESSFLFNSMKSLLNRLEGSKADRISLRYTLKGKQVFKAVSLQELTDTVFTGLVKTRNKKAIKNLLTVLAIREELNGLETSSYLWNIDMVNFSKYEKEWRLIHSGKRAVLSGFIPVEGHEYYMQNTLNATRNVANVEKLTVFPLIPEEETWEYKILQARKAKEERKQARKAKKSMLKTRNKKAVKAVVTPEKEFKILRALAGQVFEDVFGEKWFSDSDLLKA